MSKQVKTLGILGGGQLGRMSVQAAEKLGIKVHIYSNERNSPASQIADHTTIANYDNHKALEKFARNVDVVSYEFENIPVKTVSYIQDICPVYPDDKLLEIAQDRVKEKQFLNDIGIPTAKWAVANNPDELEMVANDLGCSEYILKTTRFGYDGKGQIVCSADEDSTAKWQSLRSDNIIMEQLIDFTDEISIIIARDQFGGTAIYDPSINEHKNHILWQSSVPALLDPSVIQKAKDIAKNLADKVNLVGVLALELFVTSDGELLANEIAPRTHNSGHWTIDACDVSQFENHVRTVCGLPVAEPNRHSDAVMINLLGEDIYELGQYEEHPNAHVHLYGKREVRDGRKMGHVTIVKDQTCIKKGQTRT